MKLTIFLTFSLLSLFTFAQKSNCVRLTTDTFNKAWAYTQKRSKRKVKPPHHFEIKESSREVSSRNKKALKKLNDANGEGVIVDLIIEREISGIKVKKEQLKGKVYNTLKASGEKEVYTNENGKTIIRSTSQSILITKKTEKNIYGGSFSDFFDELKKNDIPVLLTLKSYDFSSNDVYKLLPFSDNSKVFLSFTNKGGSDFRFEFLARAALYYKNSESMKLFKDIPLELVVKVEKAFANIENEDDISFFQKKRITSVANLPRNVVTDQVMKEILQSIHSHKFLLPNFKRVLSLLFSKKVFKNNVAYQLYLSSYLLRKLTDINYGMIFHENKASQRKALFYTTVKAAAIIMTIYNLGNALIGIYGLNEVDLDNVSAEVAFDSALYKEYQVSLTTFINEMEGLEKLLESASELEAVVIKSQIIQVEKRVSEVVELMNEFYLNAFKKDLAQALKSEDKNSYLEGLDKETIFKYIRRSHHTGTELKESEKRSKEYLESSSHSQSCLQELNNAVTYGNDLYGYKTLSENKPQEYTERRSAKSKAIASVCSQGGYVESFESCESSINDYFETSTRTHNMDIGHSHTSLSMVTSAINMTNACTGKSTPYFDDVTRKERLDVLNYLSLIQAQF